MSVPIFVRLMLSNISVRRFLLFLFLLPFLPSAEIKAQNERVNQFEIADVKALKEFFKYTPDRIPLVCGHRGGLKSASPENALATFEAALAKAPLFFEIDPRLTKDSAVVILHDATLDRTTTGTGKLADYTLEEVRKLKLKDSKGNVTSYMVPTIEEVIDWARGKTILMIDKKDVPVEMLYEIIKKNKAESFVLISTYKPEEAVYYHQKNKNLMFEAFIKNEKQMQAYEQAGIPWENIVAYLGQPKDKALYDMLHQKGVMVIIYTGPVYDKLIDKEQRANSYLEIISNGADILLSDRAVEAYGAIKKLMPLKSSKSKFFKSR